MVVNISGGLLDSGEYVAMMDGDSYEEWLHYANKDPEKYLERHEAIVTENLEKLAEEEL